MTWSVTPAGLLREGALSMPISAEKSYKNEGFSDHQLVG